MECFTAVFRVRSALEEEAQYLRLGRMVLNKLDTVPPDSDVDSLTSFEELSTGTLNGSHSEPLSINEFYEIARIAEDRRMYYEAVEWYDAVIDLLEKGGAFDQSITDIMVRQAHCYDLHGDPANALRIIEDAILKDRDGTEELNELMDYYIHSVKNLGNKDPPVEALSRTDIIEYTYKYEALCRNDYVKSASELAKLKCYRQKTSIPYRPADVEIVNIEPRIALFHRVIHESEINAIIERAKRILTRSVVISRNGSATLFSDDRISESGWLADVDDPVIERVSKRVEMFTGLSTRILDRLSHAETLQVLNYGIGGMYNYHYDFFDETEHKWQVADFMEGSGNRLATWMFYLSDVKFGGATVFPRAGARVPVVKGAAAFWYNLKQSGAYDFDTLHAGCPVIIGSKWVANKWIHEIGQTFRRPCARDPSL
ncbi:prolyl 4-hydroxylase subunit alpha-1-like [Tubulanus polymorphus]|uniref:prolyl 4-hydroxylase subunit alpha-1-like n=1 Tax=Tubulanus polymorphus TaxID=672921 RepID=UPI003DA23232